MKNWEVERVKEIVSDVLELWSGEFIDVGDGNGRSRSMSKQTFLEALDKELRES